MLAPMGRSNTRTSLPEWSPSDDKLTVCLDKSKYFVDVIWGNVCVCFWVLWKS